MDTKTSANHPTTTATSTSQQHYTTDFVTSRDGTTIGYRQLGHGPGLVLLHGAMESAESHMGLAQALADAFTIYVVDRRGRGLSGPYRNDKDYSVQKEVDDLAAVLAKTDAHYVFGVSAGADICLQSALSLPAIHRVALYEPAFFMDKSKPAAVLAQYDREMAQGQIAAALVTGMKGAQMGPAIFNLMPRWLLESFSNSGMRSEEKKAKPGDVTMRALAPTLHQDFTIVTQMSGELERLRDVRAEALLLGGSKSPKYLKSALEALEKTLPHVVKRVEFPGLDHGGSSDKSSTNPGGQPELVAQELRRFFA